MDNLHITYRFSASSPQIKSPMRNIGARKEHIDDSASPIRPAALLTFLILNLVSPFTCTFLTLRPSGFRLMSSRLKDWPILLGLVFKSWFCLSPASDTAPILFKCSPNPSISSDTLCTKNRSSLSMSSKDWALLNAVITDVEVCLENSMGNRRNSVNA